VWETATSWQSARSEGNVCTRARRRRTATPCDLRTYGTLVINLTASPSQILVRNRFSDNDDNPPRRSNAQALHSLPNSPVSPYANSARGSPHAMQSSTAAPVADSDEQRSRKGQGAPLSSFSHKHSHWAAHYNVIAHRVLTACTPALLKPRALLEELLPQNPLAPLLMLPCSSRMSRPLDQGESIGAR
jgi:hypothetical protein